MAVHFVYRSHYDNPGCFHRKRFEADTLLAWFQGIWQGVPNEAPKWAARAHAERLIGQHVYSFGTLFGDIHQHGWRVPKTMKELVERLNEALYVEYMEGGKHHIQVLTDDNELEMAIYIFDDHYAAKHPDRAAFLLQNEWRLPDGGKVGKFSAPRGIDKVETEKKVAGDGRTYCIHFAAYDSGGLSDLDSFRMTAVIEAVRVPDLPRFLFCFQPERDNPGNDELGGMIKVVNGLEPAVRTAKGTEVPLLKAVRANPNDTACWAAYSDWLEENGRPTLLERILMKYYATDGHTRNSKKDVVLVQNHVAQVCKHVGGDGRQSTYHHLILFDDLWANAHPLLASSILRAGNRWDIL
jgi:uncharacterized protein (TIGR02996 family)